MKRYFHFILTIWLLLACFDLLASRADTTAKKKRLSSPRSSLVYQVTPGIHPRKKVWVIGSIEFEDKGFRFVTYRGMPGWPQSKFEKMYPLNRSFSGVFIAYADIKRFNHKAGRIRLKNGEKHKMLGTHHKEWVAIRNEIKERIRQARQ